MAERPVMMVTGGSRGIGAGIARRARWTATTTVSTTAPLRIVWKTWSRRSAPAAAWRLYTSRTQALPLVPFGPW